MMTDAKQNGAIPRTIFAQYTLNRLYEHESQNKICALDVAMKT